MSRHDGGTSTGAAPGTASDVTNHQIAGEHPVPSLATFKLLADNLPTLCWIADATGYVVWYNRRWHDYCGTTPDEMAGWGWQSVHDPEHLPSVMQRWMASIASGELFEMTFPLRGADGVFRPFLTRAEPHRSDGGEISNWFGVNTEILAQIAAEDALRAERDLSLDVLNNMGDGFVLLDREFRVLVINEEGMKLEQRTREDILGLTHWEAWPDTETTALGAAYKQVMADRQPMTLEHRYTWPDGRSTWIEVRAFPAAIGLALFYREITERRQSEERIRQSNERFRAAVAAVEGVLWTNNAAGEMDGEQPAWAALTGQMHDEYQGFGWAEAVHPDDAQPTIDAWNAALATRSTFVFEHRLRRADGQWRQFSVRAIPTFCPIGELREWVGVHTDVTERRAVEERLRVLNETLNRRVAEEVAERGKAEDALRQAQKMEAVGQLTGGVAHDFNNLLTIIAGNVDMACRTLDAADGDPRARRALGNALKGTERAAALTQRLLAFSRRQPLSPKPIDVDKLVMGMSDLLSRALGELIQMEVITSPGLWRVEADPNQLESCLINLAVNARDATIGGGRLIIETANAHLDEAYAASQVEVAPGDYVVIAVTDDGHGMSKETLSRVFEPFFTTKEVGKGTGLGLSQVYGFTKQSGGHIKLYSEEGQGTTVKVYLPRLLTDAVSADSIIESALEKSSGEETILVVEDDDDVRAYSVESLRELNYHVLEAPDGPAALRLIDTYEGKIDLLFTDVVMPKMSGSELADAARSRLPHLRVLYTSGYTRNGIVHGGRLDPGVEIISKPFTYQALAQKIRDVLDARQTRRILMVDPNSGSRTQLASVLGGLGFTSEEAASGIEALSKIRAARGHYDLVLVHGGDAGAVGQKVVQDLRPHHCDLPVILYVDEPASADLNALSADDPCLEVINNPVKILDLCQALRTLGLECRALDLRTDGEA